jgi:hypothetical protein
MFSLARALFSPGSAEDRSSLSGNATRPLTSRLRVFILLLSGLRARTIVNPKSVPGASLVTEGLLAHHHEVKYPYAR